MSTTCLPCPSPAVALLLLAGCMTPDMPVEPDPYEVFHCLEVDDAWYECDIFYATAVDPGRVHITRTYVCDEGFDAALLRIVNLYEKRIPKRHITFAPSSCWASAPPPFLN